MTTMNVVQLIIPKTISDIIGVNIPVLGLLGVTFLHCAYTVIFEFAIVELVTFNQPFLAVNHPLKS